MKDEKLPIQEKLKEIRIKLQTLEAEEKRIPRKLKREIKKLIEQIDHFQTN